MRTRAADDFDFIRERLKSISTTTGDILYKELNEGIELKPISTKGEEPLKNYFSDSQGWYTFYGTLEMIKELPAFLAHPELIFVEYHE